jgi:hypothetical protein
VSFFRDHCGQPLASSVLMSPMSRRFVTELDRFVARHRLSVVLFGKGQRKDDVMAERLRQFQREERIVFIGKAQRRLQSSAPSGRPRARRHDQERSVASRAHSQRQSPGETDK